MTHGSLFSGIGGFDLAAEWMGWENKFHCEWNPFGQKVLKHYWPDAESFNDITKKDFTKYANRIDILTGGFPCQPYSQAGKRKGKEDERHLWPQMLRAIREIQPSWVVGENVFGLINWSGGLVFDEVQADLEAAGYEVWPYVLPACAVNAPHRRDRIWFVAHRVCERFWKPKGTPSTNEKGQPNGHIAEYGKIGNATNTNCDGCNQCNCNNEKHTSERGEYAHCNIEQMGSNDATNPVSIRGNKNEWRANGKPNEHDKTCTPRTWENFPTQPPICGGDDGLPTELDGITFSKWRNESIKALGNAIVPQVAHQIFKAIEQYNQL
jgi:DNA (cytosine-5)-methyltransferase 1